MTMPSLEELRRDSMNFRKKVISQFNDDTAKPKKKEKSKREKGKHKKKKEKVKDKDKDKHKVEIVSNETTSSKLIIRFARAKAETNPSNDLADEASTSNASYSINPLSSLSPPPMTAPIRLKIARSSQGGAYVAESTSTATTSKETAPKDAELTKCKVILTDFTKANDLKSNDTDKSASQRQQTVTEQQSMNGNQINKIITFKSMTQHFAFIYYLYAGSLGSYSHAGYSGSNYISDASSNPKSTNNDQHDSNVQPILPLNCEVR